MTYWLWIITAIALGMVSVVPMLYILGRAVWESVKVSSWPSIIGGFALLAFLVWVASWGPHSPD